MTTSIPPDLSALPALPRDDAGPVFKAPWEAQAFAMTVKLHERGVFTWREWAAALAAEFRAARRLRRNFGTSGTVRARASWAFPSARPVSSSFAVTNPCSTSSFRRP